VRGCYLEGNVTDMETGLPISGTEVMINAPDEGNMEVSSLNGDYATGIATAGTYEVTFFKPGYEPMTTEATIDNGVLTILDVELVPLPRYNKEGIVVEVSDGSPVGDAVITLDDGFTIFEFTGNADGIFEITEVYEGVFDVFVTSSWGFQETLIEDFEINDDESTVIEIERGYSDSFTRDYGWSTSTTGGANAGLWELGEPIGTYRNGGTINPEFDLDSDFGDQCYVTGNGGGSWANDDIDNGAVILTSPIMELASTYVNPVVEYNLWFYNGGGSGNPNDDVEVEISNGIETVTIEVVQDPGSNGGFWRNRSEITLSDFIEITDEMQLIVTAGDYGAGHIAEAAIDAFAVTGDLAVGATFPILDLGLTVAPNPSSDDFVINYELSGMPTNARFIVANTFGQQLKPYPINNENGQLRLGGDWLPGVYFLSLEADGVRVHTELLIKQ
ncbi:MAG: carboxypeptidase regulatory-like domain-containing protein, partial [Bacteroidota bacterium]